MAGEEDIASVMRVFAARRVTAAAALDLVLGSPRYVRLIDGRADSKPVPARVESHARVAAPPPFANASGALSEPQNERRSAPARDLHRARIRAKQLRYTLEFFSPAYGKPPTPSSVASSAFRRARRGAGHGHAEETLAEMRDDVE
jgi:hypothetical protein